jgi:hypothetical protein
MKEAAESITYPIKRLDVLINNAGAHFPNYIETGVGFESMVCNQFKAPDRLVELSLTNSQNHLKRHCPDQRQRA